MTHAPRLVIFDWDGTLMDSEQHIVASMHGAMDRLGIPRLPAAQVRNIIGLGMREAIEALFPNQVDEDFARRFVAAYREFYFDPDAPQALFEGARRVLDTLHAHGRLLAVATGKSRRGLDLALSYLDLADRFHASRCADETASKPDPRMLQEILAELSVAPEEAVMVGDTEYDLEMARRAGLQGIAVSYGVHEIQRLLAYAPRACLTDITQLPGVLADWNNASRRRYCLRAGEA